METREKKRTQVAKNKKEKKKSRSSVPETENRTQGQHVSKTDRANNKDQGAGGGQCHQEPRQGEKGVDHLSERRKRTGSCPEVSVRTLRRNGQGVHSFIKLKGEMLSGQRHSTHACRSEPVHPERFVPKGGGNIASRFGKREHKDPREKCRVNGPMIGN